MLGEALDKQDCELANERWEQVKNQLEKTMQAWRFLEHYNTLLERVDNLEYGPPKGCH